ncbi:MAG: hypothetical protein U0176_24610 [Bacteroidia bacterium]
MDRTPAKQQSPDGGPGNTGVNSGRAYFLKVFNYDQFGAKFPYTVQPNLKLTDANAGLKFKRFDLIQLDSRQDTGLQGVTANNVMIHRYCRVVRMQFKMWLEEIVDEETGRIIDQLQYQQIVDFEFQFGSNGGTTQWPHIQVNTLRRERDIPASQRLPRIQLPIEHSEETTGGPAPAVYNMKHKRIKDEGYQLPLSCRLLRPLAGSRRSRGAKSRHLAYTVIHLLCALNVSTVAYGLRSKWLGFCKLHDKHITFAQNYRISQQARDNDRGKT